MSIIIKLTVFGGGAECTGGIICDQEVKTALREAIKNDETIHSFMEFDDNAYYDAADFTDMFHVYGPNVSASRIFLGKSNELTAEEIEEFKDSPEQYEGEFEEYFDEEIGSTEINQFNTSNPDLYLLDKTKYKEDDLALFTQKIEKRMHYPVSIMVEDPKDLVLSNIYVGSVLLEETICDDDIIDHILYIPKDKADEYLKEFLADDYYSTESLADYLGDIYSENVELKKKIFETHRLDPGDIFGKGETENDYVHIMDLECNSLYEGGAY